MNAMFDTFKLRAEAVSAEVHRFPHKTEALDFIVGYLQRRALPTRRSPTPSGPTVLSWMQRTRRSSLSTFPASPSKSPAKKPPLPGSASASSIGPSPTPARWCRTLRPSTAAWSPRCPSFTSRSSRTGQLLPDLPSVLAKIRPEQTNYISFITGPSRTADIERVLTIGVHGPEKLIIVFVDELEEAN